MMAGMMTDCDQDKRRVLRNENHNGDLFSCAQIYWADAVGVFLE
jgi:hypothetical protein